MALWSGIAERDRWSWGPAVLSLIMVAGLNLLCQLPGWLSFVLIPISLLGYAFVALSVLAVSVFLLVKRRPKRGASVFLVLLLPLLLWRPIYWVDSVVHLGLTVGLGVGQYGVFSESSGGDFTAYDWSVGLAGSSTFLIRDISDQIVRPLAQHPCLSNSEDGIRENCAGKVFPLVGHYYICSF